jgi:hypothetical protein
MYEATMAEAVLPFASVLLSTHHPTPPPTFGHHNPCHPTPQIPNACCVHHPRYAKGKGAGTILEIQTGMIDRGSIRYRVVGVPLRPPRSLQKGIQEYGSAFVAALLLVLLAFGFVSIIIALFQGCVSSFGQFLCS